MKHPRAIRQVLSLICAKTDTYIENYLEVGVCEGHSLEVVVRECPTIEHITLIDMWGKAYGGSGRGSHQHIVELLDRVPYRDGVRFLDGDSHVILPQLIKEGNGYDLITIDGDHSLEGGKQDLMHGWELLNPEGWITFDDICHPAHPYLMDVAKQFEAEKKPQQAVWITDTIYGAVAFQKAND
jgi:predicted O-methyltransferase YrrM